MREVYNELRSEANSVIRSDRLLAEGEVSLNTALTLWHVVLLGAVHLYAGLSTGATEEEMQKAGLTWSEYFELVQGDGTFATAHLDARDYHGYLRAPKVTIVRKQYPGVVRGLLLPVKLATVEPETRAVYRQGMYDFLAPTLLSCLQSPNKSTMWGVDLVTKVLTTESDHWLKKIKQRKGIIDPTPITPGDGSLGDLFLRKRR